MLRKQIRTVLTAVPATNQRRKGPVYLHQGPIRIAPVTSSNQFSNIEKRSSRQEWPTATQPSAGVVRNFVGNSVLTRTRGTKQAVCGPRQPLPGGRGSV